jgi:GxxExxY protein
MTADHGMNGMIHRVQERHSLDESLAKQVIGIAMKIHRVLGCGFLEAVYANALEIESRKASLFCEREKAYPVYYDGNQVGVFQADFVVENRLIVEIKAVEGLAIAHSVQLVNYLAAAKVDLGLLLNFGTRSLDFKTKTRMHHHLPNLPISNLEFR